MIGQRQKLQFLIGLCRNAGCAFFLHINRPVKTKPSTSSHRRNMGLLQALVLTVMLASSQGMILLQSFFLLLLSSFQTFANLVLLKVLQIP